MKKLFIMLSLALVLCFAYGCVKEDDDVAEKPAVDIATEEAAIRNIMKIAIEGINNHDIQAHLSTLTEEFETWSGKGDKDKREKSFTELWEWQKNVMYNLVEVYGITFISPDVALYKARYESTGEIEKDGTPIPRNEWEGVWILAKKGEKWLIPAWFTRPIEE